MAYLQALLTSRRYLNTVLDQLNVVTLCHRSPLTSRADGHLFAQLQGMLKFYVGFEIDDFSGQQRSDVDMVDEHYSTVKTLQVIAFQHFDELREFAMSSVSTIDRPEVRAETGDWCVLSRARPARDVLAVAQDCASRC